MIYFIRHGITEYNKQKRFQGTLDIPLAKEGIDQANNAAELLKDVKIDIIYASPLSRTMQTAEIINKYHNAKIIKEKALIEFDVGKFVEHKTFDELPKNIYEMLYSKTNYFGEEDIDNFRKNLFDFLNSLKDKKENILLVSHGGVYTQIYNSNTGIIMEEEIENCKPVELKF